MRALKLRSRTRCAQKTDAAAHAGAAAHRTHACARSPPMLEDLRTGFDAATRLRCVVPIKSSLFPALFVGAVDFVGVVAF
mmetsp:Transcript_63737/g.174981  ORF Transcript_63737/g.174981 Transcript_63737/m.174981 type:complete len:80 (-) Transcript_63737:298-537(-)